jgi:hypothetical protein
MKNPFNVGHPADDAIFIKEPKSCCVNLYVSGLAIRKNTSAL